MAITAITLNTDSPTAGESVTASVAITGSSSANRGEVIFWTSTTPTDSDSWKVMGVIPLSTLDSGTVSHTWTCGVPIGTWYVKATLIDATQGITVDSYTDSRLTSVTYSVSFETTPNVVMLPPAEFRLCDSDNRMNTVISQYESFEYAEIWGDADSFTLTMKRTANHADELLEGKLLIVPADQTHDYYRVLIILQIKVDDETITATGRDYLWELLRGRLAIYGTGTTGSTSDVQTGVAETVARHFINTNCLESTTETRKDSFVVLEPVRTTPDTPLGETVEITAYMTALDEIMSSICTQGGIDVYGALVEDTTQARGYYIQACFRVGTDHSQDDENTNPWVVLSEEYGNARMTRFVGNLPENTVCYATGTYVVTHPVTQNPNTTVRITCEFVGDTTQSGISRRELYVDVGHCGTITDTTPTTGVYANYRARAKEAIDNVIKQSIDFELVNTKMYNRDFTIGDIITCDAGAYGSYNLQLTEVTTNYSEQMVTISVSLGAEIPGVMSVIREARMPVPIWDV